MDIPSTSIPKGMGRLVEAYNSLQPKGWSRGTAITLVSMSAIETNYLLLMSRVSAAVLPVDPNCFPTCIRVAMEADFNAQTGIPLSEGIVIDPAWYSDTKGFAIMQANLPIVRSTTNSNWWVHPINAATEWTHANQVVFEYAMATQNGKLLAQWDMGPMNLRCLAMGPVAAATGNTAVQGFPATWQDMRDLYYSKTYNDAFTNGGKWYEPPYYTGAYPGDQIGNTALAASFCGRQLGVPASDARAVAYATTLTSTMQNLSTQV